MSMTTIKLMVMRTTKKQMEMIRSKKNEIDEDDADDDATARFRQPASHLSTLSLDAKLET